MPMLRLTALVGWKLWQSRKENASKGKQHHGARISNLIDLSHVVLKEIDLNYKITEWGQAVLFRTQKTERAASQW